QAISTRNTGPDNACLCRWRDVPEAPRSCQATGAATRPRATTLDFGGERTSSGGVQLGRNWSGSFGTAFVGWCPKRAEQLRIPEEPGLLDVVHPLVVVVMVGHGTDAVLVRPAAGVVEPDAMKVPERTAWVSSKCHGDEPQPAVRTLAWQARPLECQEIL